MRKLFIAGLLAAALLPVQTMAQSAFDGTWKGVVSSAKMPTKPDVFLLQNGTYECRTCVPVINIKADGDDQSVAGNPYFDTMAIKIVDDHTVQQTGKKSGKVVFTSTRTVDPDGKTERFEFSDSTASTSPVTGKGTMTRVAAAPAGSHAISGSWRTSQMENVSDNGTTFSYKVEGDSLAMTTPAGQSYTAKLDGTDAPFNGDPGITSVSVRTLGKSTLEETDRRDGKVIAVTSSKVAGDGKTMAVTIHDKLHGTTWSYVATKQ
ncbi:MAG TPA: hypothetical protein VGI20_05490 [Rhizomicrobium sp.]|jgi:hypothetical protein